MKYLTWITSVGLISLLFLTGLTGNAQTKDSKAFNLKEAQDYAVKNAYAMKNATIDLTIAKKKISEMTSIGLPQINGSVEYQDMMDIPTMLIPDFITPAVVGINEGLFGLTPSHPVPETQYFAAKFGTQHNMSVGGTLSQLIFSGEYIVGLQATRTFYQISTQTLQKTEIETRLAVAQAYYTVLVFNESKKILEDQTKVFEKTVFETEESFKNGLIDDITVDQLKINLQNMKNSISSFDRNIKNMKDLLKFQMGMDINNELELTDSLPGLLTHIIPDLIQKNDFNLSNHIDYKILETNEKMLFLNYRKEQSAYLPKLSAYYTYQQKAMRDKFDIFGKGPWFPTSIIGINLDIPIWSSGMRHTRIQQAHLALDKMAISKQQAGQGLKMAAESARDNFNNAVESYFTMKDNKDLSANIYKKTLIKFHEGITSSTELTQIQQQYLGTLTGYFVAINAMLTAKANYDKAINNY